MLVKKIKISILLSLSHLHCYREYCYGNSRGINQARLKRIGGECKGKIAGLDTLFVKDSNHALVLTPYSQHDCVNVATGERVTKF